MKFLDSLLFLVVLLVLLWSIKADLFFLIFGTALLVFFLIQLFFMNPIDILISIGSFILLNPTGFIFLFIPLIISSIKYLIRKIYLMKTVN